MSPSTRPWYKSGCITCGQRDILALLAGTVVTDSHNADGVHLATLEEVLEDAGGSWTRAFCPLPRTVHGEGSVVSSTQAGKPGDWDRRLATCLCGIDIGGDTWHWRRKNTFTYSSMRDINCVSSEFSFLFLMTNTC